MRVCLRWYTLPEKQQRELKIIIARYNQKLSDEILVTRKRGDTQNKLFRAFQEAFPRSFLKSFKTKLVHVLWGLCRGFKTALFYQTLKQRMAKICGFNKGKENPKFLSSKNCPN